MTEPEYDERMRFEHELINRRVTWLLSTQSILFVAYGLALQHNNARLFLSVTPILGIGIAVLILVGIVAAILAKRSTWKDYADEHKDKDVQFGVRDIFTYLRFVPDIALPLSFAVAWSWILIGLNEACVPCA
jgi:hypothetical protein